MAVFDNFGPALVNTLRQRGVTGDCPMCKKQEWILHPTPVSMGVYETTGEIKPNGISMPMAAVICRSCGFSGLFSLGALGFLNNNQAQASEAQTTEAPAEPVGASNN